METFTNNTTTDRCFRYLVEYWLC